MYSQQHFYNQEYMLYRNLQSETLNAVYPFVNYGLQEAAYTSFSHALTEVAAISYLLGKGYDPHTAHKMVELWEKNEMF